MTDGNSASLGIDRRRRPHDRVGPIVFADETARAQLLRGRVATLRPDRRTVGETHARWARTGTKQADVVIREAGVVDPTDTEALAPSRELSGFETVADWQAALRELHGDLPDRAYLYDVVLLDAEPGVDTTDEYGYDNAGEWECACGETFVVTRKTGPMTLAFECPDHPPEVRYADD